MDVRLPKLGEGADSGTVVSLFVKEGDEVTAGQTILELENEKAVAPIPSPAKGRVARLRVKEGDKLSVGQVILTLEETGAATPAAPKKTAAPAKARTQPAPEPEPEPEPEAEAPEEVEAPEVEEEPIEEPAGGLPPAASPAIRKIARELGIDLRRVKGSARGERIVMEDLRAYVARLERSAAQVRREKPAPKAAAAGPAPTPTVEHIDFSRWGPVTKQPMSPLRQTISQRLTLSWNTIPHVTQFDSADITRLNQLRKQHAPAYEQQGARLTVTSFVLKILAELLHKHPLFNCSLDETTNELVFKQYCHLGLAVDTEHGLIVPVIRDADKKDLVQLSKDISDLAEKARTRKVSREELLGGTFTISNQGGIGGGHFTPVINKPQVAILGLGRAALQPVVREQAVEPRLMMPMGLSYDHRVIDGGAAARFIVDLVQALEGFKEEDVKL